MSLNLQQTQFIHSLHRPSLTFANLILSQSPFESIWQFNLVWRAKLIFSSMSSFSLSLVYFFFQFQRLWPPSGKTIEATFNYEIFAVKIWKDPSKFLSQGRGTWMGGTSGWNRTLSESGCSTALSGRLLIERLWVQIPVSAGLFSSYCLSYSFYCRGSLIR